jgi:hypothetical protein
MEDECNGESLVDGCGMVENGKLFSSKTTSRDM